MRAVALLPVVVSCCLLTSASIVGCIGEPDFNSAVSATNATDPSGTASGSEEEMVAIPATTLSSSSIEPAHKPEAPDPCKGKGKGKDKGEKCDDGGGGGGGEDHPPPPPPPPPPPAPSGEGAGNNAAIIVPSFMLDRREVNAAQYAACVLGGACTQAAATDPRCTAAAAAAAAAAAQDRGAHPINCVTRAQAASYCAWRQKRLVSDGEWTAAASGGKRAYAWGDTPPTATRTNACGRECDGASSLAADGFVATAPTGSFIEGRSPEGVLDLIGNVAEWVDATSATVRGGSFEDASLTSLSANAARAVTADTSSPAIGFRCARSMAK